jgi:hypothetical protein
VQVAADCERIHGPDDPDTFTARRNLADAYREAGRYGDAVHLGEQVAADSERTLGTDPLDTVASQRRLAAWRADADEDPNAWRPDEA